MAKHILEALADESVETRMQEQFATLLSSVKSLRD